MIVLPTVNGPQPVVAGIADAHAHLWIDPPVAGAPCLNDEALAGDELAQFADAGGTLVVDCQPGACGRNGRVLARLGSRSRVSIVAASGFHLPRYYAAGTGPWALDDDTAYRLFVRELSQGLDEAPDIRAGHVKAVWTAGGGDEDRLLRAALTAAREMKVGVTIHTEAGRAVESLVAVVAACRLAPGRVQLSHIDKRPDPGLHRELATAGYMLGYDTFLRPQYDPERHVWPLLYEMVAAGLWHQIALGLDLVDSSLWAARGGPGLRWLADTAVPRLRGVGLDATIIGALTGGNITRLLGGTW